MSRASRSGDPGDRRDPTDVDELVGDGGLSLLDLADNLLNRGVVITGDVVLGLADVDLVYLRLSLLLCAADRALPAPRATEDGEHGEDVRSGDGEAERPDAP